MIAQVQHQPGEPQLHPLCAMKMVFDNNTKLYIVKALEVWDIGENE
jgi:hypothetical protein